MKTTVALLLLLVAGVVDAQTSVGPERELLNSERIEARFGSYGIEVLEADGSVRISNLYSMEGGVAVTRTLAFVLFLDPGPALAAPHARIVAGGSIGSTLSAAGWNVVKEHRYFGTIEGDGELLRGMRLPEGVRLALHIYVLHAERRGERHPYAAIAEVHHPDYLVFDRLRGIYAPGWTGNPVGDAMVDSLLALVEQRLAADVSSALLE